MACRGVHFAIDAEEVARLRAFPSDAERLEFICNELEEEYFASKREFLAESDKAWDAMHRALADGELTWEGGEFPLNHVVLGGELLYFEDDYVMSLKSPEQVGAIHRALCAMTKDAFRERYFRIDAEDYAAELSEDDFEYTWDWFENVRMLYTRAADAGRFVLFTVDQ